MRNEATVRRDARLWALVAELEALRCERAAMEASDDQYHESAYLELAEQVREVKKKIEEV